MFVSSARSLTYRCPYSPLVFYLNLSDIRLARTFPLDQSPSPVPAQNEERRRKPSVHATEKSPRDIRSARNMLRRLSVPPIISY